MKNCKNCRHGRAAKPDPDGRDMWCRWDNENTGWTGYCVAWMEREWVSRVRVCLRWMVWCGLLALGMGIVYSGIIMVSKMVCGGIG